MASMSQILETQPGFTKYPESDFDYYLKYINTGANIKKDVFKFIVEAVNELSNHTHEYTSTAYIEYGNASTYKTSSITKQTDKPTI